MTKADKLWFATHADFRMVLDGKRYVLRCVNGATVPVSVEELAA